MERVHSIPALRNALRGRQPVAFVPTMGNLHQGHLALVERARALAPTVVVSIFVNPLQFGAGEDLDKYPRTLEEDCRKLASVGTDLVFAPGVEDLFPTPQRFHVLPPALASDLCGAARPGHFQGVATIVLKLFNIVQPQYAVFGKKDYQQLHIVRAMTREFDLPLEIVAGDTVRADDGLALSSRNGYLSATERAEAPRLRRVLLDVGAALAQGQRDFAGLERIAADALRVHGWQVDYIAIRNADDLQPPAPATPRLVVLGAARLGSTRLIDNLEHPG